MSSLPEFTFRYELEHERIDIGIVHTVKERHVNVRPGSTAASPDLARQPTREPREPHPSRAPARTDQLRVHCAEQGRRHARFDLAFPESACICSNAASGRSRLPWPSLLTIMPPTDNLIVSGIGIDCVVLDNEQKVSQVRVSPFMQRCTSTGTDVGEDGSGKGASTHAMADSEHCQ